MRGHGTIERAVGLGANDHVCWAFEHRDEFLRAAVDFLRDGLDLGQRLFYVGDRSDGELASDVRDLGDVELLVDTGTLVLSPLEGFCDPTTGVVAEDQLQFCDEQVGRALLDGFTGVRFAAEVTRLATQPLSWATHTEWEQLADSYMDTRPLAALCGYDRGVVGEQAIASLTCVHPLRAGLPDSFGIFVAGGELYLEGELDAFQIPLLRATLSSAPVRGREVVLNASGLDFVDGAATAELARFGRELEDDGRRLIVRDAHPALVRIWDLLGFEPFTRPA